MIYSFCRTAFTCRSGFLLALFFISLSLRAQNTQQPYSDLTHDSKVFGHKKYYRIYLPEGYEKETQKYPVIYFFHGWGGRHFKDDNALLEYEMIGDLVDKYQVILVMWDGNIEESEPRPYNIGNHKDVKYQVQMKDYFPELVAHIDSSYRTYTGRNQRGIIGFSMGGILSFFLAGKYPDMVCAAVNLAGTPEFFIGHPDNHTLYPVRYTFKNLMDVNTRQHNGDSDILVYLNEEVRKGAEWEGNPYEYYGFKGGHMVDHSGETKAFEMAMKFVTESFGKNSPPPPVWSHYDLYDQFEVWDYQVASNKKSPGFIYLRNVSEKGFGIYTYKWLPDGPPVENVSISLKTAPRYIPAKTYNVIACSAGHLSDHSGLISEYQVRSDHDGGISVNLNGAGFEFGIYNDGDSPEFIVLDYDLNDHKRYLTNGEANQVLLRLFNRGGEINESKKVRVKFQSGDEAVRPAKSEISLEVIPGRRIIDLPPLEISCNKLPPDHGEPFQVKLRITVEWDHSVFNDDITIPVLFDVPDFNGILTDDGVNIRDRSYGTGNGNGVAEAGEKILLYKDGHRLRLYTNDPWVVQTGEKLVDEQIPAIWEDGFTLSSIIEISGECPDGHIIEFAANYETNTYNPISRNLHWGKVRLKVSRLKQ